MGACGANNWSGCECYPPIDMGRVGRVNDGGRMANPKSD